MGKVYISNEIIEYMPDDYVPNKPQADTVYNAILDLEKSNGGAIVASKIQKNTDLGKTTVLKYLTQLTEEGYLSRRYAKVRIGGSVTVSGVYKIIKKKKNT